MCVHVVCVWGGGGGGGGEGGSRRYGGASMGVYTVSWGWICVMNSSIAVMAG